jgi:hypothetical protein
VACLYSVKNDKTAYKQVVQKYLCRIDGRYDPAKIYAWRCALVHTYGEASALDEAKLTGFRMGHGEETAHLNDRFPGTLVINVDTFEADVVWATYSFFEACSGDESVLRQLERRLRIESGIKIVAGFTEFMEAADAKRPHRTMHSALRELDAPTPTLQNLRRDVTAIYAPR